MSEGVQLRRASAWGRPLLICCLGLDGLLVALTLGGAAVPPWLLVAALAALLGVIAIGVGVQGSGIFARPIMGVRSGRAELALTFDDGPDPVHTRAVLDALEAHGHRGTFFVIGDRAATQLDLLGEIVRRGHGLGNHSLHHSYLTTFVHPQALAAELGSVGGLLASACGQAPRWCRPPVGLLSPRVAAAARRQELELVAWTASARDGGWRSVSRGLSRLLPALTPGAILVLHDGRGSRGQPSIAREILEGLFEPLAARGLRSVPLDQLVAPEAPGDGEPGLSGKR